VIEKNGLMPEDSKHVELQHAKQMTESLPEVTKSIPDFITDLGNIKDRIVHGESVKLNKKQKKILCPL
jgi:hypothetical protein